MKRHEIERIAILIMLNHEDEVRRLARDGATDSSVQAVARLVSNVFGVMSVGLIQLDVFGNIAFVSRQGTEPSGAVSEKLAAFPESIEPLVEATVRSFLPWSLSREDIQLTLPL